MLPACSARLSNYWLNTELLLCVTLSDSSVLQEADHSKICDKKTALLCEQLRKLYQFSGSEAIKRLTLNITDKQDINQICYCFIIENNTVFSAFNILIFNF